jgi:RimJ/RimL family protein N-acetyltransferase
MNHDERDETTIAKSVQSVELVPRTPAEVRAMIAAMPPDARAQLSAGWLALFEASSRTDPWIHGFVSRDRATGLVVGEGGFKGPPSDGVVEIAYGTGSEHRGKGYAMETAAALVDYAFTFADVRVVIAHTLPDSTASQRVLFKCGFQYVGEVVDPDDGVVWRFEKSR